MLTITTKKYTKKVLPVGEESSARARAERLKRLRNLSHLDRRQMCADGSINLNSLKGWEIGRYGGLPVDGAEKIIKRIAKEGVLCTLDWLLHGIGAAPQLLNTENETNNLPQVFSATLYKKFLFKFEYLFEKTFKEFIELEISDDAMAPIYHIGDKVYGVLRQLNTLDLEKIAGQDCIFTLANGEILLRRIYPTNEFGYFNLNAINPTTKVTMPVMYNVRLELLAPILIHLPSNLL